MSPLSRPMIGLIALGFVGVFIVWDAAASGLPEPFQFPAAIALGSGAAPTGAHCTAN